MLVVKSYAEDVEVIFKLLPSQEPVSVHLHTVGDDYKYIVIELPFEVKHKVVRAIIPANTSFIHEPEMIIKCKGQRRIIYQS